VLGLQESFDSFLPLWWKEYLCSDQLLLDYSIHDYPLAAALGAHEDYHPRLPKK